MSSNSTEPLSEQLGLTQAELISFLSSQLNTYVLEVFCYAIYTCVYFCSMYVVLNASDPEHKPTKRRVVTASLISVMWALDSIRAGIMWHYLNYTFITNGSSYETELASALVTGFQPLDFVDSLPLLINVVIADSIIIWRCYTVYAKRWKFVILPIMCLIAGTITGILRLIALYATGPFVSLPYERLTIAYISMTVATNILCTALIVIRIATSSTSLKKFRRAIEMLVESALLITVAYIVHLVLFVREIDAWVYPESMLNALTGIAPTLIIARVASGSARPPAEWHYRGTISLGNISEKVVSAIHFQAGPRELSSGVTLDTSGSHIYDIDIESQGHGLESSSENDLTRNKEQLELRV